MARNCSLEGAAYRAPLPIDAILPALIERLAQGHAVLTAPTGSGKTTGVPLALLDAPWLEGRSILLLVPRRPAARMSAARMAALLGEPVGERVGHQVRFERRIGPRTRIQALTDGILIRRIQHDPELKDCGLLIFDEFHERSLQADLGLALALDAAALRDDLRILVMSATLETQSVSSLLGDAPVLRGEGRSHPVTIHYAEQRLARPVDALPGTVRHALAAHDGDILAFLPGAAEINQSAARLAELDAVEVLPLHGGLSLAQQDRALAPDARGRRRVVLATDIAETSLTIEGVGVVIDTGLTRKPRFEPGNGLTRLVTAAISQASAEQRAGRAGRLGPGTCYRLWTQPQQHERLAHRPAEILEADLAPLVLELALWGVSEPTALEWLDPPPAAAWAQALASLQALGAIDGAGAITPTGRRMAELPVHPRLAHMLAEAPPAAHVMACDLAALIEERDPWLPQPGSPRPADLGPRLQALEAYRQQRISRGFDPRRLAAIERTAAQYRRLLARGEHNTTSATVRASTSAPSPGAGALLALAYPERIAKQRDSGSGARGGARYLLCSGIGAELPRDDALALEPWLVIADLEAASGDHRIRAAAAISEAEVRSLMAAEITEARALRWDAQREAVGARDETRLGEIVIDACAAPIADPDAALALLLAAIERDPARALAWSAPARQLRARVALARRLDPNADWPDFSDAWLHAHLADWLGPWLHGKNRLSEARALDLHAVLKEALGWQRSARLDQLAPERLPTPAGTQRPIDYCDGAEPVLKAPLQELFGVAETPSVFDGRCALLVHLLSPAGRPLQVTRDLAAFWRGAYTEVRKEMRGRYPKHHWPEDPTGAQPLKGGLKSRSRR